MQDNIYIYDSSGALAAEITQVIDSLSAERLSGELTLSFTSKVDRLPEITKETQIEFQGQYYRATQVQSSVSGNAFLISVSCEQESISLVDEEIEEFNFTGTADDALARLLDGTGMTATAEHEGTITISAEGGNRRSVLLEIAALCEGEIEYSGHEIRIVKRRGTAEAIDIVRVCKCSDVTAGINTRDGTESYELTGLTREGYDIGDEVLLNFPRLGIYTQKRIIGISYNPFDCRSVAIEVGDYAVDITDDYAQLEKVFLLKADAQIEFEKYINSAEGTAGIAAALSGTFVTQDALNDLVTTSELDARIEAYINGEEGIASITQSLAGTFVFEDELQDYATTTEVSTSISQKISDFGASLTLSVTNGEKSSTITLTGDGVTTQSKTIEFTGEVVFKSDLSMAGSTIINGANIMSGTISADMIDTDELRVQEVWYYDESEGYFSILSSEISGQSTVTRIGPKDIRNDYLQALELYGTSIYMMYPGDPSGTAHSPLLFNMSNAEIIPAESTTWDIGTKNNSFRDLYIRRIYLWDTYYDQWTRLRVYKNVLEFSDINGDDYDVVLEAQ